MHRNKSVGHSQNQLPVLKLLVNGYTLQEAKVNNDVLKYLINMFNEQGTCYTCVTVIESTSFGDHALLLLQPLKLMWRC